MAVTTRISPILNAMGFKFPNLLAYCPWKFSGSCLAISSVLDVFHSNAEEQMEAQTVGSRLIQVLRILIDAYSIVSNTATPTMSPKNIVVMPLPLFTGKAKDAMRPAKLNIITISIANTTSTPDDSWVMILNPCCASHIEFKLSVLDVQSLECLFFSSSIFSMCHARALSSLAVESLSSYSYPRLCLISKRMYPDAQTTTMLRKTSAPISPR